jgi:hypothetical protein
MLTKLFHSIQQHISLHIREEVMHPYGREMRADFAAYWTPVLVLSAADLLQ